MSELTDKYSKNFSPEKKRIFEKRVSEIGPDISELSAIQIVLAEMREEGMKDGGIMRLGFQDGTEYNEDSRKKLQDLAKQAVGKFDEFSGVDQITSANFPGSFDSPIGLPSDFRHQAASNLVAQALGKDKFGPMGYISGSLGSFGLGTIKELGDFASGVMDPNTTFKDAFTQAYEDTISNFKGAFTPPNTTTEELYDKIMGDYDQRGLGFLVPIADSPRAARARQIQQARLNAMKEARLNTINNLLKNRRDEKKVASMTPKEQTRVIAARNKAQERGGFQSDFAQDKDFMGGKGTAAEMGSFAKGGLARMLGE